MCATNGDSLLLATLWYLQNRMQIVTNASFLGLSMKLGFSLDVMKDFAKWRFLNFFPALITQGCNNSGVN